MIGLYQATFYKWSRSYGKEYEHNASIPRDHWLEDWERQTIVNFHFDHPLDGYRRLTYMMLDAGIVAVSAATVYRVLSGAGLLGRTARRTKTKGTGFNQPDAAHLHWHVDVSHLNICGTFYYMTSVIDGFSRSVVHHEIREQMKELDVETILPRAREKYPHANPRVITDNGPQFISNDFKQFIRISGMTHVRTSPYYPESNSKIERYHRTIKSECIRPKTPLSLDEARSVVGKFVDTYNNQRLHSAIGYITPADMMAGRAAEIHASRDSKLAAARERRKQSRRASREVKNRMYAEDVRPEDRALPRGNSSAESDAYTDGEVASVA
jgi:transposase InsO family protein